MKLNFTFFCVPRQKLLLYITFKVVSNVTKSSASDDLLHVNCNVTNRTQTCFRSTQVVYCLAGVWVLVLYWRPFYFFVVIVESLLRLFVYRSFLFFVFRFFSSVFFFFRCSAVCFGAFLHRRKCCWLQIPLSYAVFNKVCEIALSEVHATQMGVMRRQHQSQLVWNAQICSIFRLTEGRFRGNSCIVMF